MGHPSSDAVLDLREVTSDHLKYRLGATLRPADTPRPAAASERVFTVQIASPPPRRTDGRPWYEGLRVDNGTDNGRPFDPGDPSWTATGVFPLSGISPLARPHPDTVIFDREIHVPPVSDAGSAAAVFRLIRSGDRVPGGVDHFISVAYPLPRHRDTRQVVQDVATACYLEDRFDFRRSVSGFVALSLDAFQPVDRSSAEYIFFVR